MSFITDQQTLDDLNLLGKYKPNSIYSLFNKLHTAGGGRLLQEMFQRPLLDANMINARASLFSYFRKKNLEFPFEPELFAHAENYLQMGTASNYPAAIGRILVKKVQGSILHDERYGLLYKGLLATIEMLNQCSNFLDLLVEDTTHNPYAEELQSFRERLDHTKLQWFKKERNGGKNKMKDLPLMKVARYDYLLKQVFREDMEALLVNIYQLDVYISVSRVAKERGFFAAEALPKSVNLFRTTALWHPVLIEGVANYLSFHKDQNMTFLTGANMAGKSTFMKAFGIAVYLAHMGFPVAAKDLQFAVMDGLYSSINVPDDLNRGYSHFYAEVLRVKKVAEEVASGKNLVVLFDELFKGTNVKDAYDGTLSVTAAFSRYNNCFFMVSTHIIEVAEELKNEGKHIAFSYFPTVMEGNIPRYTYRLSRGVTGDRQGMMIIENEGILDLILGE